jgi:2,3-dihydroxybenzoate---[aryl-carrier protein] ligase
MLPGCQPWPDELAERYRREEYWRGETLAGLIGVWSADHGERTALVAGRDVWSYRRLAVRADRLATGLRQLGIRAGDRVIVQLPNIPEFVAISLALFRIGGLPVFALPSHRRSEIGYLAQRAEAAAYVIPDAFQGFDYLALAREVRAVAPTLRHVLVAGEPEEFVAHQCTVRGRHSVCLSGRYRGAFVVRDVAMSATRCAKNRPPRGSILARRCPF